MFRTEVKPNRELAQMILNVRFALEDLNSTSQDDVEYGIYENRYHDRLEDLASHIMDYFDNISDNDLRALTKI